MGLDMKAFTFQGIARVDARARSYVERLLPLVREKKYDFTSIVSHRLLLADGARLRPLRAKSRGMYEGPSSLGLRRARLAEKA